MSRWCDQSIPDERHSAFPGGPYEVAHLFGTLIAETILAGVHVRARKQAGHMGASDLIKVLQNLARRGPFSNRSTHVKAAVYVARPGHGSLIAALTSRPLFTSP